MSYGKKHNTMTDSETYASHELKIKTAAEGKNIQTLECNAENDSVFYSI